MTKFRKLYNAIAAGEQREVRESIMAACGFNKRTFYRKLDKPETIRVVEQKVFAKQLGMPVEKLFPSVKKASPKVHKSIKHEK